MVLNLPACACGPCKYIQHLTCPRLLRASSKESSTKLRTTLLLLFNISIPYNCNFPLLSVAECQHQLIAMSHFPHNTQNNTVRALCKCCICSLASNSSLLSLK